MDIVYQNSSKSDISYEHNGTNEHYDKAYNLEIFNEFLDSNHIPEDKV